jgi:glucose-6-phosphate 1-dehydrogenase
MPEAIFNTIVIFGASGDLTVRKLVPALYNLHRRGRLKAPFQIVGVSRSPMSHAEFRAKMREGVRQFSAEHDDPAAWEAFAQHVYYEAGDATQADAMRHLEAALRQREAGDANRLYYLSTAPNLYTPIVSALGANAMQAEATGWRRLVVEKPFGYDLTTARALNDALHDIFSERQIYRIDHYLGKETAQNILFLRFANSLFEPVWNRHYIDHIQITAAETVDVGHRADFYDGAGVLRDMFQNHMLQLLALVAMEPPNTLDADDIRDERLKLLRAIRPIQLADTVRGQYADYRQAKGVASDSQTPTYAALKLYVDNWRWQGVPFYIRSGKALKRKVTEISVHFKRPALNLFPSPHGQRTDTNILSLCLQPDEGAHLTIEAKQPETRELRPVDLEFHYKDAFKLTSIPEAYERLLLDALNGDASLFLRSDAIETAWAFIDPIIEGWQKHPEKSVLMRYERGTWGPTGANDLLDNDGRQWWVNCCEH